jgi:hypothetical protein
VILTSTITTRPDRLRQDSTLRYQMRVKPGEGPGHDPVRPQQRPNRTEPPWPGWFIRPFSPLRQAVYGGLERPTDLPTEQQLLERDPDVLVISSRRESRKLAVRSALPRRRSPEVRSVEVGGSGGFGWTATAARPDGRAGYDVVVLSLSVESRSGMAWRSNR